MITYNTKDTAQAVYERLKTARDPYLRRARECSKVTLPSLIPMDGHSGSSELYKPFQSIGASSVNNLASKLVLTLFPPGSRFFRLVPSQLVKEQVGDDSARDELEKGLAKVEAVVLKKIETIGARIVAYEAVRHCIVAGNALVRVDEKAQFYPLSSYVTRRDPEGNLAEIVIEEKIAPSALPQAFLDKIQDRLDKEEQTNDKTVVIYTWVRKENGTWKQHQEVKGLEVDGTAKTYGYSTGGWVAAPAVGNIITRMAPMFGLTPVIDSPLDDAEKYWVDTERKNVQTVTATKPAGPPVILDKRYIHAVSY